MRASCLLAFVACLGLGCSSSKDANRQPAKGGESKAPAVATPGQSGGAATPAPSGAAEANLPPLGKELCTVKGASLRRIDPAKGGGWASLMIAEGTVEAKSKPLAEILAYVAPPPKLMADEKHLLPGGMYDANINYAPPDENAFPAVKAALEQAFGVKISLVKRDTDVYVLKAPSAKPESLKAPQAGQSGSGTSEIGYTFRSGSMDDLKRLLDEELKTTVYNETKIEGDFAFDLVGARMHNPESHLQAVRKLGLEIQKEKRALDWVVVEAAK